MEVHPQTKDQGYREKIILTSLNLYRLNATDYCEKSAVFLLVWMDHPLTEAVAMLEMVLVLQSLLEL
jgi:hypothetical protein